MLSTIAGKESVVKESLSPFDCSSPGVTSCATGTPSDDIDSPGLTGGSQLDRSEFEGSSSPSSLTVGCVFAKDEVSQSCFSDSVLVEVYAPDTIIMHLVPSSAISSHGKRNAQGRLVLCRAYSDGLKEQREPGMRNCPMGDQCRFAHINVPLSHLKGDIIHVHYVYRHEDCAVYERLSVQQGAPHQEESFDGGVKEPPLATLPVWGPQQQGPVEQIPLTRIFKTEGALKALSNVSQQQQRTESHHQTPRAHGAEGVASTQHDPADVCAIARIITLLKRATADLTVPLSTL